MATRSFEALLPLIAPSVTTCPQPVIIQEIQRAAVYACERTLAWRYQCQPFNLTPGVPEYFYPKPSNTDVHVVFEAMINEEPLERLSLDQALYNYPEWAELFSGVDPEEVWGNSATAGFNEPTYNTTTFAGGTSYQLTEDALEDASKPISITQVTPDKFILLPLPDDLATYRCLMFVALKPKRNATGMDEVIMDELQELIVHNTLHRLMLMPNVSWASGELAVYHSRQCSYEIEQRRVRANLGNVRGSMKVRPKPFGVKRWY